MNSLHVLFLCVKLSVSFYVSFYYDQSVVKDSVLIFTTELYDFRDPYFINTKRNKVIVCFTYTGKNEKQMLKLFEEVISKLKEVKISHHNELP